MGPEQEHIPPDPRTIQRFEDVIKAKLGGINERSIPAGDRVAILRSSSDFESTITSIRFQDKNPITTPEGERRFPYEEISVTREPEKDPQVKHTMGASRTSDVHEEFSERDFLRDSLDLLGDIEERAELPADVHLAETDAKEDMSRISEPELLSFIDRVSQLEKDEPGKDAPDIDDKEM